MRQISYAQYPDKVYGCFIGKAISGNRTDKVRHFHLNFAVDTETLIRMRSFRPFPPTGQARFMSSSSSASRRIPSPKA